MLALVGLVAASCDPGDYADYADPQSSQPSATPAASVSIAPTIAGTDSIDFGQAQPDTVAIFTPTVTAPEGATTTYEVTFFNADKTQSITINTIEDGKILSADLENIVATLYGGKRELRNVPMTVAAYTNIAGQTVRNEVTDVPVRVILKQSEADLWYLVGSCIGDGSWGNAADKIGSGLIPLYPDPEDVTTLRYVGYLNNSGFKLIHEPGNWDHQWGMKDGNLVKNDGGSGNISLPGDPGYYEITYNTAADKITITPYTGEVKTYTTITMPGDYQGWNAAGNAMTPMSTVVENHDWVEAGSYATDALLKFANGTWDINWGSTTFPQGKGVQNGDNIPVKAGNYTVCFNDILGQYIFIAK